METVRSFVNEFQIDCDWNESGKYHASALPHNVPKLDQFSQTLIQCGIAHDFVEKEDLVRRLGTEFYHAAVFTQGGVMLQPAKLMRGMINTLPGSVKLFENSPVTAWSRRGSGYEITTPKGKLLTKNLLVCTNGFLPSLGLKKDRAFPLTLTASLTRPLTTAEFNSIGAPTEFGVLCAQAMGATFRVTQDQRIMIRNTAEAYNPINMSASALASREKLHAQGIQKRYPQLPTGLIEHTWSGVTCISGNSTNIFEQTDKNLFVAGCYNGGGIGLATLFGEQLAFKACELETPEIEMIEARPKPNRLPPQPFLSWGVKIRLAKDRMAARAER
jgi:glycine/D-amino acid oxidase-like deaminating enzyme